MLEIIQKYYVPISFFSLFILLNLTAAILTSNARIKNQKKIKDWLAKENIECSTIENLKVESFQIGAIDKSGSLMMNSCDLIITHNALIILGQKGKFLKLKSKPIILTADKIYALALPFVKAINPRIINLSYTDCIHFEFGEVSLSEREIRLSIYDVPDDLRRKISRAIL